jgi:hypothetical protein
MRPETVFSGPDIGDSAIIFKHDDPLRREVMLFAVKRLTEEARYEEAGLMRTAAHLDTVRMRATAPEPKPDQDDE